jgi:ribosome biogenesis GTPase
MPAITARGFIAGDSRGEVAHESTGWQFSPSLAHTASLASASCLNSSAQSERSPIGSSRRRAFGKAAAFRQIAAMELDALGLDRESADQARERCGPGSFVARVTAVDRARYLIRDEHGERPAELTGRFEFEAESPADLPCVGDWVCARDSDGGSLASIHRVLPRKSFLRRKSPGKDVDFQMIAANVDVAFVLQSCRFDFNVRRLARYVVMVREGRVEPVLLLTKTDLVSDGELGRLIDSIRLAGVDAEVIALSNVTGVGLDRIRERLVPGRTYCLLGSSGVGKTTLINRLTSDARLETGEVSPSGEGRHTTTRRQLVVLEGGALLIDLPGMRELGMLGVSDGLDETFADIVELARKCRFTDCAHSTEPGCAVRAAMERQELSEERLKDYLKLSRESAFHDLSYAERRRRDRDFGRFARSILQHKQKHRRDAD